MTLCEENCELNNYNYSIEKAICFCEIKTSISSNYDYKFNKKEFFKSFIDIKNIANINIIKCFKVALNIKNISSNYGFYITISIIVYHLITTFIFWFISYKKIKMDLFNISIILSSNKSIEFQPIIKAKGNPIRKQSRKNNFIKVVKNAEYNIENNTNKEKTIEKNNLKSNNKTECINIELKDFEINSLEYEEALKFDKRNYFQYYIYLLKNNHPIIFSFGTYNDYNSRIIKIFLFFFSFCSDFTINALFFNDDTMHKIYKNKGSYDLLFQIPKIVYSTLISKLIDALIKYLALSQNNIVELKKEKEKNNVKKKYIKTLYILRIKFILFFISNFIILSLFWYYITCFCGVYVNTQIHLIKDSLFSLIISLIFPFVIYLIPGIFRICALRMEKHSGRFLYKFATFLENFFG